MSEYIPRTICVGDVHGMLDRLQTLFSKLKIKKEDTVIFLGDYIDRGADSRGVVAFVLSLEKKCNLITLKGNHEDMALGTFKFMEGRLSNESYRNNWMNNGGVQCLRSYDSKAIDKGHFGQAVDKMMELHGDFFRNLQLTHEDENFIYVHGCLADHLDLADQDEFFCLWGRFKDIQPHKSGKTVICGHTIQKEPVNMGYKMCLDTGSFKSDGCITAMVIEGNKYKFIDSR
jgi:serine/threonine protein phosphatase 1